MGNLKKQFKRKEKKYTLSHSDFERLQNRLLEKMTEDQYGLHTICSLYYDTSDFELIRHSIEKPVYKEKLRVRSYGVPIDDSVVFLELKKKVKGTVYKSRIPMTYGSCNQYLNGEKDFIPENKNEQQTKREMDWFLKRQHVFPQVMICYDRLAYLMEEDPDFRVTFDFNIRYRKDDLNLLHGDDGELVAPEIDVLMEVKALGAYPLWFSEILAEEEIYPASFSKYAQTYQRYLYQEELFTGQNVADVVQPQKTKMKHGKEFNHAI